MLQLHQDLLSADQELDVPKLRSLIEDPGLGLILVGYWSLSEEGKDRVSQTLLGKQRVEELSECQDLINRLVQQERDSDARGQAINEVNLSMDVLRLRETLQSPYLGLVLHSYSSLEEREREWVLMKLLEIKNANLFTTSQDIQDAFDEAIQVVWNRQFN
ncbi:hypothetical protein [Ammoniphilus sp. CFH 90114]|uniref:hypothetical protein n=1 Tax=Ammoniphilus sp. CFH 90114 TaxID=2493665 RepID=UPI00100E4A22|nr:hypothetical protein [Ammoniphilus sp. CFH 90114]RXT02845.1 hypothetical protein EIZ39_24215 [Ammoniphilus sp. CFH 90114]